MKHSRLLSLSLVILALTSGGSATAASITLTGNVANDFKPSDPNVNITPVSDNPLNIGQASFMTQNGWVSGWAISDIRTGYDASTDTLYVGVNTFKNSQGAQAIVGDADGNGNPGTAAPQTTASGGIDLPNLGGRESVAVSFAPDGPNGKTAPGTPLIIAGVPADKTGFPTNVASAQDYFLVSNYKGVNLGLGYNFGQPLPNLNGGLAFNPSTQTPGFEFTIKHFAASGLDATKGFWISAYAGTPDDVVAGEGALAYTRIPAFAGQEIPEPTTILLWSAVAGGAMLRRYRRRAIGGRSGE